jgi:hypothetical protein
LSVGLPVPDRIIGGINFYSHSELPFDDEAVELAEVFAGYAAVVLLNGANLNTVSDLPDQVRAAFRSRITVETAKGVLMARNFSSDQAAYEELQGRAEAQHRPLPEASVRGRACPRPRRRNPWSPTWPPSPPGGRSSTRSCSARRRTSQWSRFPCTPGTASLGSEP